MFWSRVKSCSANLYSHLNLRQWSIVKKLAFLYAFSTIIIMLVISCLLYLTLENSLYKVGIQFLSSEYQLLQSVLEKYPQNKEILTQQIILQTETHKSASPYYLRILDVHQSRILQTPGMNTMLDEQALPSMSFSKDKPFNIFHWQSRHQKHFLVLSGKIKPQQSQPFYIQLALLTDKEEDILEDYWQMFVMITLLGTLFATFLGIVLARRSMRPLANIMHTVEKINTQQLNGRLIADNWPKEFSMLAKNFNEMLERLENSFERLKGFSADLAHELRTPINNLKGEAEICLSKERENNEYREVLLSSLEEYDRLSRIIEGLLFLARAEDPKRHISYTNLQFRDIIFPILEYYLPLAEENNITLELNGDAIIYANELLIQRALHNLIANALKYTQVDGRITIDVSTTSQNETIIKISDTGVGIAKEHLPHIFDRFYRTDSARAKNSGGSGLGLAIVKSIMDLHHGQIYVESQQKGTTFTLIFPPKT